MTFLWSVLEVNTGLICSCTPALKPLLNFVMKKKETWLAGRTSEMTLTKEVDTSTETKASGGSVDSYAELEV